MNAFVYLAVALLVIVTNTSYAQSVDTLDPAFMKVREILIKPRASSYGREPIVNAVDVKTGKSITLNSSDRKREGGVHSGGGTLVRVQKTLGVLDLYRFNRGAFFDKTPGHKLPYTRAFRRYEMDRLSNESSIFLKTVEQVEKWRSSSPYVVKFVLRGLQKLPIYYVNASLNFKVNPAELPQDLKPEDVKLAAWYMSDFGAFLDKNAFQSLSEKNQIAFLIHETLRHEQFSHYSDIGNEAILKLTAALIAEPQEGLSLDLPEYFSYDRNRFLNKAQAMLPDAQAIAESLCRLMNRCDLSPSQLIINNPTQAEAEAVEKLLGEFRDAAIERMTYYRDHLRVTTEQSLRDDLNNKFSAYSGLAINLIWGYNHELSYLKWWMSAAAYESEGRLNTLDSNYRWLPEHLERTNKGFRYAGGTSPVEVFMKEMKAAGFFR